MERDSIHKVGNKIILRDWLFEDLTELKTWFQIGKEWQKLDGPYYIKTQESFDQQVLNIKKQIEDHSFHNPRTRLVIAEKESNTLLGTVGCYWESVETHWLCAGITIYNPDFWGKGIGYEALGLWTEYLFSHYEKIVRLDLRTWSGNTGLIKLAEKLGFIQEACFRNARIVDGQYYDSIGLGILKTEFAGKFPKGFLHLE